MRSRQLVRCPGCGLAVSLCLCASLPRILTGTRVVVVMHRNEVPKTSNTGRLALRMLDESELCVRGARGAAPPSPPPALTRWVLFPAEDAEPLEDLVARERAPDVLVVPDGSWSQARRIVRRDPWSRGARVVRLGRVDETRYDLRRGGRTGTVCTLEAVARALSVLERRDLEAAMLPALDDFMGRVAKMRAEGAALANEGPRDHALRR